MNTPKWKIIQTYPNEYLLLSDSATIKKIKGESAADMIVVLSSIQENKPLDSVVFKQCSSFLQQEKRDTILSWLIENQFIASEATTQEIYAIDIIGEFGTDVHLLNAFIAGLPDSIRVSTVSNLSKESRLVFEEGRVEVDLTLLIGPYFYNAQTVEQISFYQKKQASDFLFVEFYGNGILLGPLMNSNKETVCLTCVETRKLFNTANPDILIDHIWERERIQDHAISVFDIGSFSIHIPFIYNELKKVLLHNNKTLYNKAVFIDYNRYNNQSFHVLKSPSCEICSTLSIYNPL